MDTKKKKLPQTKASLPVKTSSINFDGDVGRGLEGLDAQMFAVPFLNVLQKNSPACDRDSIECVKGAEPGDFLNTATREAYSGKQGIIVVPAATKHTYVEWVPRDQGGGYRGELTLAQVNELMPNLTRDTAGRYLTENGNHLVDTRYHYLIHIISKTTWLPVVMGLTSTQIKKSRNWVTQMDLRRVANSKGVLVKPPSFLFAYKLTTRTEQNEKGSWKGIYIEDDHMLKDEEAQIYLDAKSFLEQVHSGLAVHVEPQAADDQVF